MKMHTLIVKVSDDEYGWIEYVDYMVESYAVDEKYKRADGVTWEALVEQAKKKHGKENVRVAQVDMLSNCAEDSAAYNIELSEKLDLNQHTIPKN